MPIHYSWVNVTCHPEWLQHFKVDAFQVPTVVYLNTPSSKQAQLIGTFNQESIQDHEQRFLKGKLSTQKISVAFNQMLIEEGKDCQAGIDGMSAEDEALWEEIRLEMEEEERQRQTEQEEEVEAEKKTKKVKKKKGKKGKKG